VARSPDLGAIGAVRRAHGRPYLPRRPERTALHAVVRDHLETFLAERQARDRPLPRYAERALRGLLGCGDLASGFARFRCPDCRTERLVPFSCKDRGVCASCMSRRQTRIAAHLVDQVITDVPVRQWVLSMPFWLRFRLAFDHDLTLAVHRVAARLIERFQRDQARRLLGVRGGDSGAVTVLQRFGSSCELNLHFHTVRPDGVFTVDRAGDVTFHRLPAPERHELDHLVQVITAAVKRLLVRRGLWEDDGDGGQPTEDAVDEP